MKWHFLNLGKLLPDLQSGRSHVDMAQMVVSGARPCRGMALCASFKGASSAKARVDIALRPRCRSLYSVLRKGSAEMKRTELRLRPLRRAGQHIPGKDAADILLPLVLMTLKDVPRKRTNKCTQVAFWKTKVHNVRGDVEQEVRPYVTVWDNA
uniref:Uncharacterized protein n=1 Tax=Coccidioides posadasii RMSCC 3488 TaxID=454284 RepID=A0A0J6F4U0_COCPO|nr:hypothetical protein CPAG_01500 [Coccidioides posadasii RMSCC 3488]